MTDLTAQNADFWNELCGTTLARHLGIADDSPESLRRFDDWYFAFYPYLLRHVPLHRMTDRKVLEIGLGYGSLSQKLCEAGCDYHGLDIAPGPVAMVNHRLRQAGLSGGALQGDVLQCPFPDDHFDFVVAIGCLHHTGDLTRALEQVRRVLKPGGEAIVMVYYAFSYRRWLRWPGATGRHFLNRRRTGFRPSVSSAERAAYDQSSDGSAAPETTFASKADMDRFCAAYSARRHRLENIGGELFLRFVPRNLLLRLFGRWFGLDLYSVLTK